MSDPPRVHRYTVSSRWRGSTGAGYDAYDRSHEVEAMPAEATLALSSDRAFRGDATLLNPEQLLVMAASSCQLLSFLAVAARARIDVIEYRDDAEGEMPENDPPIRITRITLRPQIVVWEDVDEARVRVETARLVTRDTLDQLCSRREALVDLLLAAPFDLPTPAPVRDDGRPEAGRRDALALIEAADAALEITEEQRRRAAAELERAARERAELGDEAEVESLIAGLQRELPEVIELPPSAPPSAALRLQRAGLRVTVDAPA